MYNCYVNNKEMEIPIKIAIIGTGYIGLVTGMCLSDFGNNILCVGNDKEKIYIPKEL